MAVVTGPAGSWGRAYKFVYYLIQPLNPIPLILNHAGTIASSYTNMLMHTALIGISRQCNVACNT